MNLQLKKLETFQQLTGQTDISRRIPTVEERKLRLKLALEELTELADAYGLSSYFGKLQQNESEKLKKNIPVGWGCDDFDFPDDTKVYNEIEVLDALCDQQYILSGSIVTSGLQNIFDEAFDLVHENNMTKFHKSVYDANETKFYHEKIGTKCEIFEIVVGGISYFIVKNESGKILKPYTFEPVNLKPLLDE